MTANPGPPQWAEELLEQMLADRGGDIIAGDLREEYVESKLSQRGRVRANWWYLRQVASFVRLPRQRRLPGGSNRRAVVARVEVHSPGMRKAAGSTPAGGSTDTSSTHC